MPLRQAAAVAVWAVAVALLAALSAVAVGCGGDTPPPEQELIKGLILLPPTREAPGPLPPAPAAQSRPEPTPRPAAAADLIEIAGSSFVDEPLNDTQTYYCGDEIRVSFSFEDSVEVIGRPQAQLLIGYAVRYAAFANIDAQDPTTVYFTYTVQKGDQAPDGAVLLGRYIADADNYIRKQGSAATSDIAVSATTNQPDPDGNKVDGRCLQPTFAATPATSELVFWPNTSIATTELPAATGGNGPLTYELIQCDGSDNDGAKPTSALFDWLTYQPPDPADDHGGRLLPVGDAAPLAAMPAVCFNLIVQDADSDLSDTDSDRYRFSVAVVNDGDNGNNGRAENNDNDNDNDDDGLIEVDSLAQLDAIRYDLNGDGIEDNIADADQYAAAFPNPLDNMGCPSTGCIGYELTQDLDFGSDDASNNESQDWQPIGNSERPFIATLDGQGYAIANLSIRRTDGDDGGGALGLFGAIGSAGVVQNLGLPGVRIHYAGDADVQVGSIAGISSGAVSYCYASGVIDDHSVGADGSAASVAVGGLIGSAEGGTITGSYANVDVSGGSGAAIRVGGLVGSAGGADGESAAITVTGSYAAGAVNGGAGNGVSVGGLIGELGAAGRIANSYAVGVVRGGADSTTGGLVGIRQNGATVANSYYDAGSTGQSAATDADTDADAGQTTRALQSPTGNTGIYDNWNPNQWDFGASSQYPAVTVIDDRSLVPGQRMVSLQADNWNHPVAGEAVEVILNGRDAAAVQWQSSATGARWTDIDDATGAIYVPVADDAADGGKYLRAKVTFAATAAEAGRTITTVNTAKVIASSAADLGTVTFMPQRVVGSKLEHELPAGASAQAWRWQRCDDPDMTQDCTWIEAGLAGYTLQDGDVGKYLRAYVYYRNSAEWHRAETPVIGPVVAAPSASASAP